MTPDANGQFGFDLADMLVGDDVLRGNLDDDVVNGEAGDADLPDVGRVGDAVAEHE